MKSKTILVTGCSGFVAEHLIPILKKEYIVIGIDRKDCKLDLDFFIKADLNNTKNYKNLLTNVDTIIHLAAARADWGISREEFYKDNVDASRSIISVGHNAGIKNWIFVSSVSTMPQNTNELLDEAAPFQPINDYGYSKMEAENEFNNLFTSNNNISLSIIRPTVLYGPSNPHYTGIYRAVDNNIFRLIDGIYNRRFMIVGNGKTIKSTAYVKNFVDSILHLLKNNNSYRSKLYVYADEPPKTTLELVKYIRKYLNKKGNGLMLPYFFIAPLGLIGDFISIIMKINIPITSARIQTFNRPTNFRPSLLKNEDFHQRYSTVDGLKETVDWYNQLIKDRKGNFFLFKKD
tara:strand:+ start:30023 stop:31063 length:1041 start_codon:yes stop_codon:yes gene_type:complete